VSSLVLILTVLAEGKQRRPPKLEEGQLIEACKPKRRTSFDYGYGNLLEAGIYEKDGKTPLKMNEETKQFEMKIDQTYHIKAKFDVKKFSSFGSYPKYFGIKVTESYKSADRNTKGAFESIYNKDLIGTHECSQDLRGSRGARADGCQWATEDYKVNMLNLVLNIINILRHFLSTFSLCVH